jgi:predicted XRE-type DNA-binding protein
MTQKTKPRVTRSSGNVFRDLGFPPDKAEHLLVRADVMIRLEKELGFRGLKQAQAAKLLGITQPRVGDLLRGRVELFSADALIDMLARLGNQGPYRSLDTRQSRVERRPSASGRLLLGGQRSGAEAVSWLCETPQ